MLHFRQNIRLIRKAAGLTQTELGEKIGATEAIIKSWEGKKGIVPDDYMQGKIARFAGISKDDLLSKLLTEEDIRQGENVEKVPRERSQSWEDITHSNRQLADAQLILAEGYRDLISILKTSLNGRGSVSLTESYLAKSNEGIHRTVQVLPLGSKRVPPKSKK